MPGQPTSYKGTFEGAGDIESLSVSYDTPLAGTIPVFRFPSAGRVTAARVVAKVSSAGTNVMRIGLINGGQVQSTGLGTIITAPTNSGTVIAGSAYDLTVASDGKEQYAAGDWVCLNVAAAMTPIQGAIVEIDYHLDQF